MIRDFSQEAKNTLYEKIDAISPNGTWEYIKDFLADAELVTMEWVGKLSIESYLNDIDSYHTQILDRNDANKKTIDRIFNAVQEVDANYANYFQEIRESLASKVEFVNRLSEVITIKEQIGFATATCALGTMLSNIQKKDVEVLMNAYANGMITEFSDEQKKMLEDFVAAESARLGHDIARDGEEEKGEQQWFLVDVYRILDLDKAEKFDALFESGNEPIKEFDRYNIMYIVYTADEPFKSLFLETLGMYSLGDVTYSGTSFYTDEGSDKSPYATENTVNINCDTGMYYSDKGPYNSFFHECGHAIDRQMGENDSYSTEYMDGTNFDVMYNDVYTYIEKEIREYCAENRDKISEEQTDAICNDIIGYIQENGYNEYSLTGTADKVYQAVHDDLYEQMKAKGAYKAESQYVKDFKAYIHAGISDAYSGITNNIITGDKYHNKMDADDIDNDGVTDEYIYWYDLETHMKHTGNQEKEMFAHYFSFGITGTEEAVNDMRNVYLPNTMKRYDEMANDMLKKLEGE